MNPRRTTLARGAVAVLPALDARWFGAEGGVTQIAIVVGLAIVAIAALVVAGAAYHSDPRRRRPRGIDDEELFTTTPLPMPKEELARMARERPQHAFTGVGIPRWVQVGSLLLALGATWAVATHLRSKAAAERAAADGGARSSVLRRDDTDDSPEDLDLSPDSAPPFAFRARDWLARNGGCAGVLEVTRGDPTAWTLTARVHNDAGRLIDTARVRVAALREGDVIEFPFPRTTCDAIGAWDVRGARTSR